MKVGTKSVLFGVHAFWIHPIVVAIAWCRLFGFPRDPRIWFAFFVHDLGYWGCADMDGTEGERHPELGAAIMRWLFGDEWGDFCLLHSRTYAKLAGRDPSKLAAADKLAWDVEPWWLYLPRAWATGELREYMDIATASAFAPSDCSRREWYRRIQKYGKEQAHLLASGAAAGVGLRGAR